MTTDELRETASLWHGGQGSALYAFSSTGTATAGLWYEVMQCRKIVTAMPHAYEEPEEELLRLQALADYAEAHTPKEEDDE
jgi:hypothetical protein